MDISIQFTSKINVFILHTTEILNGGCNFFNANFCQSNPLNHGCLLISAAVLILESGLLSNSFDNKSIVCFWNKLPNLNGLCKILLAVS